MPAQYIEGEQCASKLDDVSGLNRAFVARGPPLRMACLNNAAIVRLKQCEWEKAAALCARVLALEPRLEPPAPLLVAKAHFRLAVAKAKLGDVAAARVSLLRANSLVPEDREVVGMLRVLRWGQQRRRESEAVMREAADAEAAEAELAAEPPRGHASCRAGSSGAGSGTINAEHRGGGAPPMPPLAPSDVCAAQSAWQGLLDPSKASDASGFGQWAPEEPTEVDAPLADPLAPGPPPAAAAATLAREAPEAAPGERAAAPAAAPLLPEAMAPAIAGAAASGGAGAAGARRALRFVWARDWLRSQLVGLCCQDEDGAFVGVRALSRFGGEAYVETTAGARGRTRRVFDLHFALDWQAKVGDALFEGSIALTDVSCHNELAEYDVRVEFGDECPPEGSEAQMTLVALLGPLRAHAALAAEGRLMQQVWRRLGEFHDAFEALDAETVTP